MMFSAIRRRMSYANVTATLALFFAMSGGALAASHYLLTSTKQISPKVLKALEGKPGAAGASGAVGSGGPVGAMGPAGATGPAGPVGATGTTGPAGPTGPTGAKGAPGPEGVCSTSNCVLPIGVTETGTVAVPEITNAEGRFENRILPISFPIRLAGELNREHTEIVKKEATGTNCTGTPANPTAPSGFLCVYVTVEPEAADVSATPYQIVKGSGGAEGASTAGALVKVEFLGNEQSAFFGTWAVTG